MVFRNSPVFLIQLRILTRRCTVPSLMCVYVRMFWLPQTTYFLCFCVYTQASANLIFHSVIRVRGTPSTRTLRLYPSRSTPHWTLGEAHTVQNAVCHGGTKELVRVICCLLFAYVVVFQEGATVAERGAIAATFQPTPLCRLRLQCSAHRISSDVPRGRPVQRPAASGGRSLATRLLRGELRDASLVVYL